MNDLSASSRITYPVAMDDDYAVWRAFGNHYWPALYFADSLGRIRHHHFGEGEYGRSEMVIQQLLAEAGLSGVPKSLGRGRKGLNGVVGGSPPGELIPCSRCGSCLRRRI